MDGASYPTFTRRVLWHPIVGIANHEVSPSIISDVFTTLLFELAGQVLSGLDAANFNNGDLIVTKSSQLNGQAESIGTLFGNTVHALAAELNARLGTAFDGETESLPISDEIRRLLSTDDPQDWTGDLTP